MLHSLAFDYYTKHGFISVWRQRHIRGANSLRFQPHYTSEQRAVCTDNWLANSPLRLWVRSRHVMVLGPLLASPRPLCEDEFVSVSYSRNDRFLSYPRGKPISRFFFHNVTLFESFEFHIS